jgi:8-oxo-dGTP pyrophosphatase MutT (NUDIX family)
MSPLALAIVAALGAIALGLLAVWAARRVRARSAEKWSSAGGVVVDADGCVAVIRERDRRGRRRWTLPKGRIDPGETPEAAALREVYEESGLRASIVRPIVVHEGRWHFTYYFEMKLEHNDGRPEGGPQAVRLVSVAKATDLLSSRRDLGVLRRWLEMRTGVAGSG